ncbi:hypothetical protein M5K25_014535 [Dendrobium thyrsiflorum]|uniref:Wound-responsive family protein n=1 Tax=Dendrobium thyrsiflorum TaxID=117978 RepID=A0ABD0UWG2_DENTH
MASASRASWIAAASISAVETLKDQGGLCRWNYTMRPQTIEETTMASANRASWIVAASISAVETLKDQGGLCRWNYTMRSLHQKANKEMGTFSLTRRTPSSSSSSSSMMAGNRILSTQGEQAKRAEESFRKVMYLSCWGPN